jgi:hypothetical protein
MLTKPSLVGLAIVAIYGAVTLGIRFAISHTRAAEPEAYADLTTGCNAATRPLNHGVVVIRTPAGTFVPDQDFTQATP